MKKEMKKLNKDGFNDIHIVDYKAYATLIECQQKLQDSHDAATSAKEKEATQAYRETHAHYLSFLQQKAKHD